MPTTRPLPNAAGGQSKMWPYSAMQTPNSAYNIYAIGDLHLSTAVDKPMDLFGEKWTDHWQRISRDWRARVRSQDVVLLPGDISWGMQLCEALPDLQQIHALPGRKVMIKGNHDYWWSSLTKLAQVMPPSIQPLQNDCLRLPGHVICGTRGWTCPSDAAPLPPADQKIYLREAGRLELSLTAAAKQLQPGDKLTAMLHYPPFNEKRQSSLFTQLLRDYGVHKVVYAHLHGRALRNVFEGALEGVDYALVSCDYLECRLKQIWQYEFGE